MVDVTCFFSSFFSVWPPIIRPHDVIFFSLDVRSKSGKMVHRFLGIRCTIAARGGAFGPQSPIFGGYGAKDSRKSRQELGSDLMPHQIWVFWDHLPNGRVPNWIKWSVGSWSRKAEVISGSSRLTEACAGKCQSHEASYYLGVVANTKRACFRMRRNSNIFVEFKNKLRRKYKVSNTCWELTETI